MKPDRATERQIQAADPGASTWLSANAGSGKTRVLTNRVARLLLRDVSPQNILCLTYTKAAASEMQNRLFQTLGAWAMKEDTDLRIELARLGVEEIADLSRARQLFARAIETPGGLKIQTIHSFCASILRRFPLEAGLSPQFREMDERSEALLREAVLDRMAQSDEAGLVARVAAYLSDATLEGFLKSVTGNRDAFNGAARQEIWDWFDLPAGFDDAMLLAQAFAPGDGALIDALLPILRAGSATEVKAAEKLAQVTTSDLRIEDIDILTGVLLFGEKAKSPFGAKIGQFPNKPTRAGPAAALMPALDSLMVRIEAARTQRNSLYSAQKTYVLHQFAGAFIARYEAEKLVRGWVDFDDLIRNTAALLRRSEVAAWVLYRLDGGIDHILVDEAQDTNPEQWEVIEALAREFTTGESARKNEERTIFVVGDPKQSIYSFQGAAPGAFERMKGEFGKRLSQVGRGLTPLQLEYSFRTAGAILDVVDRCLDGLPGVGQEVKHLAFAGEKPGRIDLWPVVEKPDDPEDLPWTTPLDRPTPENHHLRLARAVADEIERIVTTQSLWDKDTGARPARPGDVMVLVRRRSTLFDEIIRACKSRGLPIAGADRLRIGGELAVKDLTALLRFLATPEDDLSLAAALRSPLFGWSEAALYDLAQGRSEKFLWRALEMRAGEFPETHAMLRALRDGADFLRPYDLLERILIRNDGRRRLLARLGAEAEDGIDALLHQAMVYERAEVPSLTGFLLWLDAEEVEIKRQMDSAGDQIRVMTVHGAKGLEAPIVILPECERPTNWFRTPQLLPVGQGRVIWPAGVERRSDIENQALTRAKQADFEEWIRLLYVAMTRAENWLIVAAAGEAGKTREDSWYGLVKDAMERAGAMGAGFALGPGLRHETGHWPAPVVRAAAPLARTAQDVPRWAMQPAEPPEKAPATLAPSDLGGAKVLATEQETLDAEAGKRRGRQVHLLLEHLQDAAPSARRELAAQLLSHGEDALPPDQAGDLAEQVGALLDAPDLARLFARDGQSEVGISADIPELGGRIHGAIDRLIVEERRVLAVDFKTNAVVPGSAADIPEGILRQMAAYHAALTQIYPDRPVELAILWTVSGELMTVPDEMLITALRRLDLQGSYS